MELKQMFKYPLVTKIFKHPTAEVHRTKDIGFLFSCFSWKTSCKIVLNFVLLKKKKTFSSPVTLKTKPKIVNASLNKRIVLCIFF